MDGKIFKDTWVAVVGMMGCVKRAGMKDCELGRTQEQDERLTLGVEREVDIRAPLEPKHEVQTIRV